MTVILVLISGLISVGWVFCSLVSAALSGSQESVMAVLWVAWYRVLLNPYQI